MRNVTLWLSILTSILIIIKIGCSFIIHFGGQAFKNDVKGYAVLGIITAAVSSTAVVIQLI